MPLFMASKPTKALTAPDIASLIWLPASSPAAPISARWSPASSAPSAVSSSDFFARRSADTSVLRMIFIGCWNALLMFFAFRTMLLAKTSARFLVKSIAPVTPLRKDFAMLCPASRPSAIAPLNEVPMSCADSDVFLICARKRPAAPPESSISSRKLSAAASAA